jgi:CRISPR-associated protein Csm2
MNENRSYYQGSKREYTNQNRRWQDPQSEEIRHHIELTKENYVGEAEKVIQQLKKGPYKLTTSKIRKLLALVSELYNDVKRERSNTLNSDWVSRIQYVRMHIAYEAGRDSAVKKFVEQADLLNVINHIGTDKEKLIIFCHYMEALVAYHRYYGGKD